MSRKEILGILIGLLVVLLTIVWEWSALQDLQRRHSAALEAERASDRLCAGLSVGAVGESKSRPDPAAGALQALRQLGLSDSFLRSVQIRSAGTDAKFIRADVVLQGVTARQYAEWSVQLLQLFPGGVVEEVNLAPSSNAADNGRLTVSLTWDAPVSGRTALR